MKRVFADTHFFIALLSERDAAHQRAVEFQQGAAFREVITTSWVLVKLADSA